MFDLNLTINTNDDDANNCDGWSGETSAANGEGESSSSNDDTYSASGGAAAFTFSFDAANNGLNSDQGLTSTESALVTRDLFPVSRLDESGRNEAVADHGRGEMSMPQVVVQQELQQVQAVQARKSRRGPRSRSSQYRGVTFYRRTGRWESHIWDCGKQVYLGGFDTALAAARAYDRAAIKFRGVEADINFNLGDYDDMKPVMNLPKDEFVQLLRRQSTGFSRGSSKYRGGVALQKIGRWEARTGGVSREEVRHILSKGTLCFGTTRQPWCAMETTLSPALSRADTMGRQPHNCAMEPLCGSTACLNFVSVLKTGSQHDLNLNLGMSASSPNKSGSLDSLKLHHDAQTSRTLMLHAGTSASNAMSNLPLEGVPVASKHPILGSGVDPKFVPHNEERGRSGTISQLEMANLAWRMNGHDQTTSGTAASSGFSSQAPSGSASPVPFDFSSHANTLACYSWMKPYLPPS